MVPERETVIFFDIRNFSVHRLTLGQQQQAKVMTQFVRAMLNHAVEILRHYAARLKNDSEPLLNHTGDGFVLVIRGEANPVLAFLWISKFEEVTAMQIRNYERQIGKLLGEHGLPQLAYGIGVHHGPVSTFHFKGFRDKGNRESRTGFLGTPANIASRVEQCTKGSLYNVLCTKRAMDAALLYLSDDCRDLLRRRFTFAGSQKLRGIPNAYHLYGFTGGFHRIFRRSMLKNKSTPANQKASQH
jgi:class 3 adenylate cyclase